MERSEGAVKSVKPRALKVASPALVVCLCLCDASCRCSVCVLIFSQSVALVTWKRMFDELLNIRSCSELPDLMSYRMPLTTIIEKRVTVDQLNTYVSYLQRNLSS